MMHTRVEEYGSISAEDIAPRWKEPLCLGLFLLLCFETVFSVPYRSVALATHSNKLAWVAGVVVCLLAVIAFLRRSSLVESLQGWRGRVAPESRGWFVGWLAFGLIARLLWAVVYPITLKSDGLAYFSNAKSMAELHTYPGAYWPPGFALFLTPFFMVLGAHVWVTVLCTLLTFAGTYWLTYVLGKWISGREVGGWACAFFALWPTDIALASANAKETLIALLVTAILLLYLAADRAKGAGRFWCVVGAGILMGCAALVQPAYLLFPAVLFCADLVRRKGLMHAVAWTALAAVAMLATVSPWTYRNYLKFHRVVLISTNGGSVFYRANNPDANAAYSAAGEEALPKDEFVADKEGYRAGEAWIRQHPGAFAELAVRKQVGYLGDDGAGPFETMKRDLNPVRRFYAPAKLICNLYWLAAWCVLLIGASTLFRSRRWMLWFGVCFLPLVYQWSIDMVFESASRHHVSYVGLMSLMVAMVIVGRREKAPETVVVA